jgi:hypothetical protein
VGERPRFGEKFGRDVAGTDVFRKREIDEVGHF